MSFASLIAQWPTIAALARETGVPYATVKRWKQRATIPSAHWLAVVAAANRRGILISVHDLAALSAKRAA